MSWLPTAAGGGRSGRAFLDNFSVLFKAENCSVIQVHAWDGGVQRFFVAGVPNIDAQSQMSGDWTAYGRTVNFRQGNTPRTMSNVFTPRERDPAGNFTLRHAMLFGLGISVQVDFTHGAHPMRIVFLGAGANWHDVAVG
jgi:hypothetical protein